MPEIITRERDPAAYDALTAAGVDPRMARVYAARDISGPADLNHAFNALLAPGQLHRIDEAALLLADAIVAGKRLLIVADYDADGATACAVGLRALRAMGATVDFIVPDRFRFGYGLTPEIVRIAAERSPEILVTVDNGIASVEGVAEANRLGMRVLVTDHHLPGDELPDAACIINPNQPGCSFPSKHLAGVGVMFYLLLALRAELRKRGAYASAPEPNLTELLDLVALGTVADLVRLDENNRILVEQGLRRIRAGKASSGINALLRVAGRDPRRVCAQDMGFGVAPRLNAAGRLQDMALGIDCLLSSDEDEALRMAQRLDTLNRERRDIEADMHESALAALEDFDPGERYSLSLYQDDWHQGVIGILASRLKERFHRPTIVFAPAGEGMLKGSGRSITGLHLRDALDLVSKRHPGLLLRFGGHAMAAGLTIAGHDLERFTEALESVVRDLLTPADLECVIETDGAIDAADFGLELAEVLEHQVWGQGFAAPEFDDRFTVTEQRIVGERHLKLKLEKSGRPVNAILFNCSDLLPAKIRAVYRPQVNDYNGNRSLQLVVRYWEGC